MKLAVYGTLRSKGGVNESWGGALSQQKRLGQALLPSNYGIFNLGGFPAVKRLDTPPDNPTVCEVYEIDEHALARCDRIEGHPNFYERQVVDIEGYGDCWVYLLDDADTYPSIESGDWYDK